MTDMAIVANMPIVLRISDDQPQLDWYLFNAPRPLSGDGEWEGEWLAGTWYASVNPNGPDADRHIRCNQEAKARVVVTVHPGEVRGLLVRHYWRILPGDFNRETRDQVLADLARCDHRRLVEILFCVAEGWTYSEALHALYEE